VKIFDIRPARPLDIPFIYETWLKSYKHDSAFGKSVRSSVFFPAYGEVIDNILLSSTTIIACHPEEPDIILGYLVYSPTILHYVFVKEAFRGLGIARTLYETAQVPTTLSHRTGSVQDILARHSELVYNPFVLFNKENK
jgi:hypothetical protein